MVTRSAKDVALPPEEEKADAVRKMFGAIAPRYDLLNRLLSLSIDRRWRRRAVDRLLEERPARGVFLDACAGTMDLALELAGRDGFEGQVIASDFTFEMLERGEPKIKAHDVVPTCADALRLPFADDTFDGVTVGFGVRNLAGLDQGLTELARVLKPGARLVILEFTTPRWQPFRALYLFYFLRVLPLIGRMISRHSDAYTYLPASVLEFPEPDGLAERMRGAGFERTRWESLTAGIAAIHIGEKGIP